MNFVVPLCGKGVLSTQKWLLAASLKIKFLWGTKVLIGHSESKTSTSFSVQKGV